MKRKGSRKLKGEGVTALGGKGETRRGKGETPLDPQPPTRDPKAPATARARTVDIYTDGACKGNPGLGGWGALLIYGDEVREIFGGELHTTNNRMELTAVIRAFERLKRRCNVRLHTDSIYVKQGITVWIHQWKKRGWKTSDKKPVKNVDLWKQLDDVIQHHEIEWIWVRGHDGDPGNERADELANLGCAEIREKTLLPSPFSLL